MRYRAIVLCGVLIGGFLCTGSATGQETFRSLSNRVDQLEKVLHHAIILTDQDCTMLGTGWRSYTPMDGKMPLASGVHTDGQGETRTFVVGQADGAFSHQLTEAEMPSHVHQYHDRHFNNARGGPHLGDDDDRDRHYMNDNRNTGSTGAGQPHNNMPPYLVLNFCLRVASPD